MKAAQFVFLSAFFILYGMLNWCVFWHAGLFLGMRKPVFAILAGTVMPLLFIGATAAHRSFGGVFPNTVYTLAVVWMGAVFIAFCIICVYRLAGVFFRIPAGYAGAFCAVMFFALSVLSVWNARSFKITQLKIPAAGGASEMRFVHISDLHIGSIRGRAYLEKVVAAVNKLAPDLICVTGDLIDITHDKNILEPLSKLSAPAFYVTGNHEYYAGISEVMNLLKKTPLKILDNETARFNDIDIIGLSDLANSSRAEAVLKTFVFKKTGFSVMLAHRPVFLEEAAKAGIDLVLSGHTHNGQIFPFTYLVKCFFSKISGLYGQNRTRMYVSQGTSTWGPPMRLFTSSEIVCIDVHKS